MTSETNSFQSSLYNSSEDYIEVSDLVRLAAEAHDSERPATPRPPPPVPVFADRTKSHKPYQYPSNVAYVLCKQWNGHIVRGYFDTVEKEWKNSHGDMICIQEWI